MKKPNLKQQYRVNEQIRGVREVRIVGDDIASSVVSISTALQIPSAIFTESYLSFVGLGVQAPMPSLG